MQGQTSKWGTFGAFWGVLGVSYTLVDAVMRLTPKARSAFAHELTWVHWTFLVAWCGFMIYTEAYRGFHCAFSPRVVARAMYLRENPRKLDILLAPFFCAGFYRAIPRRIIATWILTIGIVTLILMIRMLAQPWRGLVDTGVVLGLAGGFVSIGYWALRAATSASFEVDPEVQAPLADTPMAKNLGLGKISE